MDDSKVTMKGRLGPGMMITADLSSGQVCIAIYCCLIWSCPTFALKVFIMIICTLFSVHLYEHFFFFGFVLKKLLFFVIENKPICDTGVYHIFFSIFNYFQKNSFNFHSEGSVNAQN